MRVIGLDVGTVRIGISLSDMLKITANPYEVYKRKDLQSDLNHINEIIKQKQVDEIVVGLPLAMNGQDSIQTQYTRKFAADLEEFCGLKVNLVDERLSSATAERVLIEGDVSRAGRKDNIDKVAAAIILQMYLDKK